jgi:RNA polymerase sigma-70 factor (sigma-E family)
MDSTSVARAHSSPPDQPDAVLALAVDATLAADARSEVTALYREHALGLARLAYVILGDRTGAEDVVQEAFCGLYRRFQHLSEPAKAVPYLRSSVLNGCRSQLRRSQRVLQSLHEPPVASAESAAMGAEERREVVAAMQRLPGRQREVLILRFYLDLSEAEIAGTMHIAPSTVRSTLRRGLQALGVALKETS